MHKPAIIAAILALVAAPACTAGQAPIGRSSQAVDELELEPSEIPPRRGELMPRVQGGVPSESPWAKIEFPEPGVVLFDGRDGHPLLDVPEHGLTFADEDELSKYVIEHFNAKEVTDAAGHRRFALTVLTAERVGFAENVTDEAMTFTEVRDPLFALLGGREGTIHLQDKPPIPTSFQAFANCGSSHLSHQGYSLAFKACSAYMPSMTISPAMRLHAYFGSIKVTPPPSPSNQSNFQYGGCAAAGYPGGGGGGGGGGIGGSAPCTPTVTQSPPSVPPGMEPPKLSHISRAQLGSNPLVGGIIKPAYWLTTEYIGPHPDGEQFLACSRTTLNGSTETWDIVTYPSQLDIKSLDLCY